MKFYLYALCEPEGTNEVRYIGVTQTPRKRFRDHLEKPATERVRKWINALADREMIPTMRVMNAFENETEAFLAEAETIRATPNCLNHHQNCRRKPVDPLKWVKEREGIKSALEQAKGINTIAAAILGINRNKVALRRRQFGL